MSRIYSIFFFIITTSSLFADYPTVWSILNESGQNVSIVCKSDAYGLNTKLDFVMKVGINEHKKYVWSGWHYNDGMGLSPGDWKCTLSSSENKSPNEFRTDWGENADLVIVLKDNKLSLKKK